jgi:hypothetical protein
MTREEYNKLTREEQKKAMRIAVTYINQYDIDGCTCSEQVDGCKCKLGGRESRQREAFAKSLGIIKSFTTAAALKEDYEKWYLIFDDYVDDFIDYVSVEAVEEVSHMDVLNLLAD